MREYCLEVAGYCQHVRASLVDVLGCWPADLLPVLEARARGEIPSAVTKVLVTQIAVAYAQRCFESLGRMHGFVYYPSPLTSLGVGVTDAYNDASVAVTVTGEGTRCLIRGTGGVVAAIRSAAKLADGVLALTLSVGEKGRTLNPLTATSPLELYFAMRANWDWRGSEIVCEED